MNFNSAIRIPHSAFTLVELLVVITIIVLLLALLTPALDKAVYRAELTVCASQLRGVSAAAVGYAAGQQRRYPHRKAAIDQPGTLMVDSAGTDDRPAFRSLLGGLKPLVDPMTGKVNLDVNRTSGAYIRTSYMLWFGWQYTGHKGMRRIGDKFTWGYTAAGGTPVVETFDLLASDWDEIETLPRALASHPDRDGLMRIEHHPDVQVPGETRYWTDIRWLWPAAKRPPLDLNYARQDLSVFLLEGVLYDDTEEPRTVPVPLYAKGTNFTIQQVFIPAE